MGLGQGVWGGKGLENLGRCSEGACRDVGGMVQVHQHTRTHTHTRCTIPVYHVLARRTVCARACMPHSHSANGCMSHRCRPVLAAHKQMQQ